MQPVFPWCIKCWASFFHSVPRIVNSTHCLFLCLWYTGILYAIPIQVVAGCMYTHARMHAHTCTHYTHALHTHPHTHAHTQLWLICFTHGGSWTKHTTRTRSLHNSSGYNKLSLKLIIWRECNKAGRKATIKFTIHSQSMKNKVWKLFRQSWNI